MADEQLIDMVTKKLLAEFGAGGHKPGSGSAAAFQGMVASMLLSTVIDLTNDPARKAKYKKDLPELLRLQKEILSVIYPNLTRLFQQDSDHFDRVITLRNERDAIYRQKDPALYSSTIDKSNEAQRIATELPIEIAHNAYRLGRCAAIIFDKGFQSARGDASVGLNSCIAVMSGCLSIINLNLCKLPADQWMETIRPKKEKLKLQQKELDLLAEERQNILEKEAEEQYQFQMFFADYRKGTLGEIIRTDEDIEILVRDFQNKLWEKREKIWKNSSLTNALEVLKPQDIAPRLFDFTFQQADDLGIHLVGDVQFEVAGLLDRKQKLISVSRQFPVEVMRFTAAHELGHLILHKDTVLHRDRPIDGSHTTRKSREETQADKFAAYFLMPAAFVTETFEAFFEMPQLAVNENTVLALGAGSIERLRNQCEDRYGFAKFIASSDFYAGKSFKSLATFFGVSVGAMAKRLIELDLVAF